MNPISKRKLQGVFFFNRLKRRDKSYLKRLEQRYADLKLTVSKTAHLSVQDMVQAYFDLMELVHQIQMSSVEKLDSESD